MNHGQKCFITLAPGNTYWIGRHSEVDLLVLTSLDLRLLKVQTLFTFLQKQSTLIRRSMILSLSLQLVFLGLKFVYYTAALLMNKNQLTGQNLGWLFYSRSDSMYDMHFSRSIPTRPILELITQPEQLLGSLPLDFAVPGVWHAPYLASPLKNLSGYKRSSLFVRCVGDVEKRFKRSTPSRTFFVVDIFLRGVHSSFNLEIF